MPVDLVCKEIADSETLRNEAARVLPDIERLATPAGIDGVQRATGPLLLMFPPAPGLDPELDALKMVEFYTALEDLPVVALDYAVSEYIRTAQNGYFPIPGKIRKLALEHVADLMRARMRLRRALELKPASYVAPSREERMRIAAEFKDLAAGMAGRRASPLPPPHRPGAAEDREAIKRAYAMAQSRERIPMTAAERLPESDRDAAG